MTHNNAGPLAAILAGMTAAATAGTYVGARLAGKSHKEASKKLVKNTLHAAMEVTHAVHTVETVSHLAESTSSQALNSIND
ncbi:hypothetical protein [Argonema antarcticum]|uniref:hypothetical protein n=1 Tax=Argonema antarcticum TaxID=2942763 RepID=UPI0020123C7E|nr:hypothetical protein [Argonema antarcticum]MCL1470190.1 hypothetical protein [Argonema antarcticum A004/B2]